MNILNKIKWLISAVVTCLTCIILLSKASHGVSEMRQRVYWSSYASDYLSSSKIDVHVNSVYYRVESLYNNISDNSTYFKLQLLCLTNAIYYEARSETYSGKAAVAEVVRNRVNSKHFPNTICDVVFQGQERKTGCQFSFTCDGSMLGSVDMRMWEASERVAVASILGVNTNITINSTHYHTTSVEPKWAKNMRKTRQFDTHIFYRFK